MTGKSLCEALAPRCRSLRWLLSLSGRAGVVAPTGHHMRKMPSGAERLGRCGSQFLPTLAPGAELGCEKGARNTIALKIRIAERGSWKSFATAMGRDFCS